MAQNMASINAGATTLAGAINLTAGYAIGATSLVVNNFTGAVTTGDYVTIAGEMYPHRITSHTETLGNTTGIVLHEGLTAAVANAAVVTTYQSGVTTSASYTGALPGQTVGYSDEVLLTSMTVTPQVGQLIAFGSTLTDPVYTIISVDGTNGVWLDRPLETTYSSGTVVHFGPPGNYNLAFHRNALALVVRPLSVPMAGAGALSAVVNHNGLSMRVTISYLGLYQGHLVTLDMLCGIALLDTNLGAVMLG